MAYTPFQDGTQAFAIPDSPITVSSVAYIAENIQIRYPSTIAEIRDPNAIPTGQAVIPDFITLTAKLQLATGSTVRPIVGSTFTLQGDTWINSEIGHQYSQGQYQYVDITARRKINA